MANTYRVADPTNRAAVAAYAEGVFEREFSATEEADALASGLELVPRTYKQLSDNYSATEQGGTFEAAFLVEVEAALIAGGHIERVDDLKQKPRRGSTTKKEED